MTSGKVGPRPRRGKKTRSSRGTSNDTMRRMDEKHGSRNEDRGRGSHPTDQEVNKEWKKDRLSSRESAEERRERVGKRRRNDNLEKLDLRAKRSSTTGRHHSSPSWRKDCWIPWMIQNPGTHHQELLVAVHSVQRLTICRRMPTLSTSENEKRENSHPLTTKCHPRTTLGTHHHRLHHWTTNITRIWCDNGSHQLIHQVCHSRPHHWRNIFHGNHQAFPR